MLDIRIRALALAVVVVVPVLFHFFFWEYFCFHVTPDSPRLSALPLSTRSCQHVEGGDVVVPSQQLLLSGEVEPQVWVAIRRHLRRRVRRSEGSGRSVRASGRLLVHALPQARGEPPLPPSLPASRGYTPVSPVLVSHIEMRCGRLDLIRGFNGPSVSYVIVGGFAFCGVRLSSAKPPVLRGKRSVLLWSFECVAVGNAIRWYGM